MKHKTQKEADQHVKQREEQARLARQQIYHDVIVVVADEIYNRTTTNEPNPNHPHPVLGPS